MSTYVTKGEIRSSLTSLLKIDIMMTRGQECVIVMKGLKIQKLIGFFQGQAILNACRVTGYYYSTCARVAFKDPLTNQALDNY